MKIADDYDGEEEEENLFDWYHSVDYLNYCVHTKSTLLYFNKEKKERERINLKCDEK